MRKFRKFTMGLMLSLVLLMATGCSCSTDTPIDENGTMHEGSSNANGTTGNGTTGNGTTGNGTTGNGTTGNNSTTGSGIIDDIGDDIKDGIDDIGNDLQDGNNRETTTNNNSGRMR